MARTIRHEGDVESELPRDFEMALEQARPKLGDFARDVRFYETVGSTNDVSRRLAEQGAIAGVTVLADRQTAGRGRVGRSWFSPPGAGLYVSVILESTGVQTRPGLVTLGAGVALAEAIRATTAVAVLLKWPNDLVIETQDGPRRKLGGILAEGLLREGRFLKVILGFGLNVASVGLPANLGDRVTSLEAESGGSVDRAALLVEVLARLRHLTDEPGAERAEALLTRWQRLSPSCCGTPVSWSTNAGPRHGTTAGVDADGALVVETPEGRERILSADVRWP